MWSPSHSLKQFVWCYFRNSSFIDLLKFMRSLYITWKDQQHLSEILNNSHTLRDSCLSAAHKRAILYRNYGCLNNWSIFKWKKVINVSDFSSFKNCHALADKFIVCYANITRPHDLSSFFFISVWRKCICFFLYFIQGSIDAYKNSKLNTFPSSLRKIYSNWNRCIWIGKMFFSHSFFFWLIKYYWIDMFSFFSFTSAQLNELFEIFWL